MINQNLSMVSLESMYHDNLSSASTHTLSVSVFGIVDSWPRFAGHLSQYEPSLAYCLKNDIAYEETFTGWLFSELYLEILALLNRNSVYFSRVQKKKVSGLFWPSLVPAFVRQWIIDHSGEECFA